MTKTIVIASGKGGVGKTNISVNTALELARRQHRTCLLDADLGLANVNILLGIHPEKNLDDVIFGGIPLDQIIVETEYGVDIIPGSSGVENMANLDSVQLSGLVESFGNLTGYDYFLIDTSSGISRGVISFCLAATETILVLTAEATSLADAYALLKVLSLNHYQGTVKILVNKCASVPQAKKTYKHFKEVADKHLQIEVAPGGAVLVDPRVEKAVSWQQPVTVLFPDSAFSQCIRALVSNLIRTEPEEGDEGDFGSFWNRYANVLHSDLLLPGAPKLHQSDIASKQSQAKECNRQQQPEATLSEQRQSADVRLEPPGKSLLRDGLFTEIRLPSPAPLLSSVLELEGSGQLTIAEMEKIIVCDPGLIGKTLQAYSPSQTQGSNRTIGIRQAVAALGEEAVVKILTTTASHSLLSAGSVKTFMAVNELWVHSYRCGLMSEALAELIAAPFSEEAFLAGVLHDVGRLALLAQYPEIYAGSSSSYAHAEQIHDAEMLVAGTSHAVLGAEILAAWGVGSFTIDAARYHDETAARIAGALDLTKLVYLAQKMCSGSEEDVTRAVDLTMKFFGLSASQVFTCMQQVGHKLVKTTGRYNIPCNQDIPETKIEEILGGFRQQAVEYVTQQSVLPRSEQVRTIADTIRSIHQGLNLLFGMSRIVCLLPDTRKSYLQAAGYPSCYGSEVLENIRFSLSSEASRVVSSYRTGNFSTILSADLHTISDRELANVLRSDGLICLPLVSSGATNGLVVCGVRESEYQHCLTLQKKLEKFSTQAAVRVAAL